MKTLNCVIYYRIQEMTFCLCVL